MSPNDINAVALRAKANPGGKADLSNVIILFAIDSTTLNVGALIGDSNAAYVMIVDSRFAGGFTLLGDAVFDRGGLTGSNVMYQAKVGDSTVPIPAALPLLGTAVLSLGLIGWRQRKRDGTA